MTCYDAQDFLFWLIFCFGAVRSFIGLTMTIWNNEINKANEVLILRATCMVSAGNKC